MLTRLKLAHLHPCYRKTHRLLFKFWVQVCREEITESQYDWDQKGPPEVNWSNSTPQEQLLRTVFRWVLKISKEEDTTTSLGKLLQCFISCIVKKYFFMFCLSLLYSSLCPLILIWALNTTEKSLAVSSFHSPFKYLQIFHFQHLGK